MELMSVLEMSKASYQNEEQQRKTQEESQIKTQ